MCIDNWYGKSRAIAPGPQITDGQTVALLALPSTAVTAPGYSATVNTGDVFELLFGLTISRITGDGATFTPRLESLGTDGAVYVIWQGPAMINAGQAIAQLGNGAAQSIVLGAQLRIAWDLTGDGATVTFSASIQGR